MRKLLKSHLFIMEFIEIMPYIVPSACMDRFILNSAMDAFKVINHFFMHGTQLFIEPDRPIFICFFASFCIGASAAVFACIILFMSAIFVCIRLKL